MADGDTLAFFRDWMRDPLRVASVVPSGEGLAREITRQIGPQTGPVLELGPGTGVFTRALLARGVAESDLTLVELGEDFAARLALRHPQARILRLDASRLSRDEAPRLHGATVSGLPVLSMNPRAVMRILSGAFALMHEGGAFYQFTYAWRCPIAPAILERLGLEAKATGHTMRNLPPAQVYRISRIGA